MRRPILILLVALLGGVGLASSLVIYPFDSQDPLLGVAVADALAAAFEGPVEVVGPAAAPGLLPPLIAQGGFLSLGTLVGPASLTGPSGAQLMRSASGADVAATGAIAVTDKGLELSLDVASAGGLRRLQLEAPKDAPGDLARQAAPVLALALGVPTPAVDTAVDLSGPYGDYVRALTLVGAGLPQDAAGVLDRSGEGGGSLSPRAASLRRDIDALLGKASGGDPTRVAVMSLSLGTLDEARSATLFAAMKDATGLPVADVWVGTLDAAVNDKEGAVAAFDRAAEAYPFGRAARAAYRITRGDGALDDVDALVSAERAGKGDAASLLGAAVAANEASDVEREKAALVGLGHVAPFLPYSFERLGFIAFDQDQPLAAAEALAVAVQLEPDSDLYWTNLGWAYYLLGFLQRSEDASLKALDLDASQAVAAYNLGLVRSVTGRLSQALDAYAQALRADAGVDDEAVHDLERARTSYPDQAGVHFALARLYEAQGRRTAARDEYRAYLRAAGQDAPMVQAAIDRVKVLSAPPPPVEIAGDVTLHLGRRGSDASPFHPGDPLVPSFELSTPGDALPRSMHVLYQVVDDGGAVLASAEEDVAIPENAVGFVVDDLEIVLPDDLPAGSYRLTVRASAGDDEGVDGEAALAVAGEPEALRRLVGRGVVMKALDSGAPLYGAADLGAGTDLVRTLLDELQATAGEAEQALPKVDGGRFDGLTGSEVFQRSTAADVQDFLTYLLASGAHDTSFTFVDAYAQWVLDGAPLGPSGGDAP